MSDEQEAARQRVVEKRRVRRALLEVVRYQARQRCKKSNCGTVCLCPSCHARVALEYYEKHHGWPGPVGDL